MELKYAHVRCGDDLLAVAVDDPPAAQALAAHLRSRGGWLEVVPGIESVTVRFDAATLDIEAAEQRLTTALSHDIAPLPESEKYLEIPVVYGGDNGPDLDDVCERLGLSVDEFVAIHCASEYRVDMVGFTPGFVFVGGLDERLNVPRREEPRQKVAAGSVAIAGGRTGMYALSSPGGWNLIGRTSFTLFDAEASNPFPIQPGMRIRYRTVEGSGT